MSVLHPPAANHELAPDAERLSALVGYGILDTAPEEGFDELVQLARTLCAAPVALVSLIDRDRQWFKANSGFPHCETDLNSSVCKFVLDEPDLLVIPDLTGDPRTATNPLVTGKPGIRFYAGAPLRTPEGHVLGSLCVIDHYARPKGLTGAQAGGLRLLASQVMRELNTRRALNDRDALLAVQDAALRRERRLETLTEASATLFSSDDPAAALAPILATEASAVGFEQSYTYAVDSRRRCLTLQHAVGVDQSAQEYLRDVPFDVPLCGIVADNEQPLILRNVQDTTEPRYQIARDAGLQAFAGYPFFSAGQIRGVISFGAVQASAFDPESLKFFATIARFLSLAYERLDALALAAARERELVIERGLLQAVQAQAPVGLSIAYPDGTGVFSARAREMLGHGPDEDGDERYVRYHAEHADGRPYEIGDYPTVRALRHGVTVHREAMLYRPGGGTELRRWTASSTPVRNAQGEIVAAITVLEDREDQLRVQDALEVSLADLQRAQEAGGVGLFTVRIADDVIYPTPEFCRLYGLPVQASYPSTTIEARVLPEDRAAVSTAATRQRGELISDVEYRVRHQDTGEVRWIARTGRIESDETGRPVRFTGTARNITVRKLLAQRQDALIALGDQMRDLTTIEEVTLAASGILGTTLDVMLVGYGHVDPQAETITVARDWTRDGAESLAGTLNFRDYGSYIEDLKAGRRVVIADARTDPRTRAFADALEARSACAFVNMPVIERGRLVALLYVSTAKPRQWSQGELVFIREVADRVRLATARIRAEEQQRLLNLELSHRLKNILAMVQAIATQTLRNAPDPATARVSLSARLVTLSRAHDILIRGEGESASLRDVIAGALDLHDDRSDGRFVIDGPAVTCSPRAALSIALLIHELATNAAKYGALHNADGQVTVAWSSAGPALQETLTLIWHEQGGPPVLAPTRRGFGSRLIERGLAGAVGGEVQMIYDPAGLVCTLTAPLSGFGDA